MHFDERSTGLFNRIASLDADKKEYSDAINKEIKDAIELYAEETGLSVAGIKAGYTDFKLRAKDEAAYLELDADRDKIMSAIAGDKAVPCPQGELYD